MNIIVTGGAGFIGSNFVFYMLNKYPDYRIVCLDKLTYAGNLSTLEPVMDNPNFRFVKADICDREAVYKLFEEEHPDMVVNFAAESHVDRSIENPEVFLDTNIKGTAVMMDACRKYGIKRYHQVSTDEVYGDLPLDRPDLFFTEETPIHTSSPYSSSKAAADLLVLAYHRTYGLPVTISRCSNNYGPYHFPEKLIPLMIANGKKIIDKCIKIHGPVRTSVVLDHIKAQGYKYSTKGAITVAVCDAVIPPQKKAIIAEAEKEVDVIRDEFMMGLRSNEERYEEVLRIWEKATNDVTDALQKNLDRYNPIFMMADSGARGSMSQIRQLAGMRGLIANTSGKTIEIPIRANYREGLNILEYFISSRGARKGLADTALRTADSGYLTRRLVDVSQEVIIREEDCGTTEGLEIFDIKAGESNVIEGLHERLIGRYLLDDFCDSNGNVLVSKDVMMGDKEADIIVNSGVDHIKIRSVLECRAKHGACRKCYGSNLANRQPVTVGEAVGIIAAQSIGEPGTQLTMRTFHTGGVASAEDITQGLPRVEELFEARKPKSLAIISEIDGDVRFEEIKNAKHAVIFNKETGEERAYLIPFGFRVKVFDGDHIKKGDKITDGAVNPHDILDILGPEAVMNYLISEVQSTYRLQGVEINDKHIEVIVRQMMRKVKVEDAGDTGFMSGQTYDKNEVLYENEQIKKRIANGEEGLREATFTQLLLGITKAALATDSFLSAASFQETTRVLTDAAIKGKVDPLVGLKENVILGKIIPAGTGMQRYADVQLESNSEAEIVENDDTDDVIVALEDDEIMDF